MNAGTIFQSDVGLMSGPISPVSLSRASEPGLALLLQARAYACQLAEDPWQFAVEIDELKLAGLTVNDLRWMMMAGYVEHAGEMVAGEDRSRQFKNHGRPRFSRRSCFILTDNGFDHASRTLEGEPAILSTSKVKAVNGRVVHPEWNPVRHELTFNGRVVKRFKQHSPNQEAVLSAFQEEDWPAGVLDPLCPVADHDSKQRLRDTIKNLNRHQLEARIHFSGDGSGERILWEAVDGD